MKAQNGLKFPLELCFGIMNLIKDSYLQNSKVAFLKSEKMRQECVLFMLELSIAQLVGIYISLL